MNFIVQLDTTVGELAFGPFLTLEDAKKFSGSKYPIYGLFEAKYSATHIQQMTKDE